MPTNNLLVVRPDGSTSYTPCSYAGIKRGLNGAVFDFLRLDADLGVYIDDEGMLTQAVLNVPASMLMCRPIWGPVVVCQGDPDDEGDTQPPSMDVAKTAFALARTWRYIRTEAIRLGQDIDHVAVEETLPPPQIVSLDDEQFERFLVDGVIPRADG